MFVPRRLVGLLVLGRLTTGSGKAATEWLIKSTHADTMCHGATSAILEPLEICVAESATVFTKKSCQALHDEWKVSTSYFPDAKCKKKSYATTTNTYPKECSSREKYECTGDSPILFWPARAYYPLDDVTCSGWSENVKAFSTNCTGNVTAKATCTDTKLIYNKYTNSTCSPATESGRGSEYRLGNCSLDANGEHYYFASCDGAESLPGVTSNGSSSDDTIAYSWWGILLTCTGVVCIIGVFLRVGLKNGADNAEEGDEDDEHFDYAPLRDVDALRGSFSDPSSPPNRVTPSENAQEDGGFVPSGGYLPMETSDFDIGDIDRMRGSYSQ